MQMEEACLGGKTQSQTEQILRGIFSFCALGDWYVNLKHCSIDQVFIILRITNIQVAQSMVYLICLHHSVRKLRLEEV